MIVQSPARLDVASRGTDGNIMPLLAAALMAELERHIVSAEQLKAKLTPKLDFGHLTWMWAAERVAD